MGKESMGSDSIDIIYINISSNKKDSHNLKFWGHDT